MKKAALPRLGRIAGLAIGLLGGWYGLAAGFLLGSMVDVIRGSRTLRRFYAHSDSPRPPEPRPGLAAAAGLALRGSWAGLATEIGRQKLFFGIARDRLGLSGKESAALDHLFGAVAEAESPDLPGLARSLAGEIDGRARDILADYAYALAAGRGTETGIPGRKAELDHEIDTALRLELADSGLSLAEAAKAREKYFPVYRDPWTVLGLRPGASIQEIKSAWRRLSRKRHPDTQTSRKGKEGEKTEKSVAASAATASAVTAFVELKDAYEYLKKHAPS